MRKSENGGVAEAEAGLRKVGCVLKENAGKHFCGEGCLVARDGKVRQNDCLVLRKEKRGRVEQII